MLNQIGWKSRIQSIVTEEELILWYEKALRGKYASELSQSLLTTLQEEMQNEFPSIGDEETIIDQRDYEKVSDPFWM